MFLKGVRSAVENVNPYISGKTIDEVKALYDLEEIIKLGSNENAYGPFKHARQAMIDEIDNVFMYPDQTYEALKEILSKKFMVSSEQIAIGHGAGGILETLARTFIESGDEVIIPSETYGLYFEISKLMAGKIVTVPLTGDYQVNIDGVISQINSRTKIIWLCNPNNPTGTVINQVDFDKLLNALPSHTWLVLDEAYAEFSDANKLPNAIKRIEEGNRIIIVRTFSKAYALAGVRVGYAISSPEMIKIFDTVAEPFNANRMGLVAAIASLKHDSAEYERALEAIKKDRERMMVSLKRFGFEVIPSQANFIFVNTPYNADLLADTLLKRGIIIRSCTGWGYEKAVRISVGTSYENKRFLEILKEVIISLNSETEAQT